MTDSRRDTDEVPRVIYVPSSHALAYVLAFGSITLVVLIIYMLWVG